MTQAVELGGKFRMLASSDFKSERAANYGTFGASIGAGQTCIRSS